MLKNEGKLAEALATYEAVYETFAALDAKQQMAVVLGEMANIYKDQGEMDQAIELQTRKLNMVEKLGNETSQAITMHQLAMLYRMQEDYATALARSQAAEALNRKGNREHLIAGNLHEQGIIYNQMANAADSDRPRAYHGQTAAERFQDSLDISTPRRRCRCRRNAGRVR